MKQTKRLFAILLTVVMLLGVVPVMNVGMTASAVSNNWSWPTSSRTVTASWPKYSDGTYHSGIDFGISEGSPVYSTCDGEVVDIQSLTGSYGKHIKIRAKVNGETVYIRYAHLSGFATSIGAKVSSGEIIGYSGNTGRSTGPHLHYEVRNSNDYYGNLSSPTLNPSNYLPGTSYTFEAHLTPGTPTLTVSSQNVSNKNVTFTWNKVSNVDHYDLRVYNYGDYNVGAPYGEFGISGSRTSSSIRLPKGKYAAYITAVSSSGAEAGSEWITFNVSDPPGTPVLTINNIYVTDNIDNGGVEFKWTKAANTDHYDLRVYNHGNYDTGAPYTAFNLPASQTSTKMKLPIGKYAAYITAVSESGAEAPSEWITVFNVLEPDANANFPTNIKTYKMWTGDTSTVGYDCSNYN